MACHDRYGSPLSTSSEIAAAAYRDGVDRMLAAWPGAVEAFETAIASDPDFALAHIARARIAFIHADGGTAQAEAALARELVGRRGTAREKSHVETLALGMEGRSARSLTNALAHLEEWPRDAFVFVLPMGAFGLFAFSGMADHDQARVDLAERHARHYGDDWFFLTYLGWSHTENGNVGHGREITQRAFERRSANANAVHALAHAMFEDGSGEHADQLITGWLPSYDRSGLMHGHISWHQALVALEKGNPERALAIYAERIQPKVTTAPPINSVTDGASLLWRLAAYGHAVPKETWDDAAAHAERSFPKAGVPFADMHMALVAAATGSHAALAQRIAELEKRLSEGRLAPGAVLPTVCRAMLAFAEQKYVDCARLLEPVAADVVRIGGSHAQREIVEDTLLVAFMKGGEAVKARDLLDRRLHRRPSPRDTRWRAAMTA
ncbi:tetratricopeptide repeat protein [Bradyrhizobium sp. LHD-71]|uniref:tetratricopeptide repeat protein n=1 Tax=Bradyrhizobium sp. LHD-71 TaxID=3072141 RepID=UPI00280CCA58|nr:tetratricopeptide repeat protein [Bradyrhizobium sp. LHD-71]MDQ8727322.1 tetratricopeptide repeat protein [Bradyrhizobium sp. LHD-71]